MLGRNIGLPLRGGIRANNRGAAGVEALGIRVPKKAALVAAYGLASALLLIGPDLSLLASIPALGRRLSGHLATKCIHNIYIPSGEDAMLMPPVPEEETMYVPTSIAMCYEWIRRDALSVEDVIPQKVNVLEHRDVCLDWSAPHYSMMEIVASSVINTILPRIRYRHGCPVHRQYEEAMRGYDWSTFQSVFQEPAMAVNRDLVDPPLYFKDLCKACLEGYNSGAEEYRVKSRSFHHCFTFPKDSVLYKAPVTLSPVSEPTSVPLPSEPQASGNIAPISSIKDVLKTRLWHSAAEWNNVTDHPPKERVSGTVILIDNGSTGVDPTVYTDFIDPTTQSISIIAGPLCHTATLPTGQRCMEYGKDLKDYLARQFPLPNTGFEGGPGVDFQISASTAGTFSRAILAKDLLCPPNTATCLLPAMGKKPPTKSTIMECSPPCPGVGAKFFDKVGTSDNTDVVQLPDDKVPPPVEGTPAAPAPAPLPPSTPGVPVAPQYPESQVPIVGDAFDKNKGPPPPEVDVQAAATKPSSNTYRDVEPQLPPEVADRSTGDPEEETPLAVLPNVLVDYTNMEKVPSPQEVDDAVESAQPLNSNTPETPVFETPEEDPAITSSELATDEASDLVNREMTDESYTQLAVARRDSKERIVTGYDGNYLFEVPCPTSDQVGNVVITDDGYAITDNNDTVIVSDGTGTVTFEAPVQITTVPIKEGDFIDIITNETFTQEYVTINDPILGEDVNVTAAGIVTNPDSSLSVTDPVGQLVVIPETQHCVLITMGKSKNLKNNKENKKNNPSHTIIEGTVVSTGNENIPPDETGHVIMDDSALAVTASTEEFSGFLPEDPNEANTGAYQQILPSELSESVSPLVTKDNCKIKEPDFSRPVRILDGGQLDEAVEFEVLQTFKGADSISWVAIDYKNSGQPACVKYEEVPYGKIDTFFASCDGNGVSVVDVYIHDGSKKINQDYDESNPLFDITDDIPGRCEPSSDWGNKCWFRYALDCRAPAGRRLDMKQERVRQLRKKHSLRNSAAAMTPKNAAIQPATKEDHRLLFAQNILRRCPELGKAKVYDHFEFGGKGKANRIPLPKKATTDQPIATTK